MFGSFLHALLQEDSPKARAREKSEKNLLRARAREKKDSNVLTFPFCVERKPEREEHDVANMLSV
jgi:hypothetical protein